MKTFTVGDTVEYKGSHATVVGRWGSWEACRGCHEPGPKLGDKGKTLCCNRATETLNKMNVFEIRQLGGDVLSVHADHLTKPKPCKTS